MTNEEFNRWFSHHRTCYPSIDAWLGKLKGQYDSKAVLKNWYEALKGVDLADAMEASSAMFRGDLAEPKDWSGHPKTVRKAAQGYRAGRGLAGQDRPQFVNGVQVFKCKDCYDSGVILVWHPRSMQAVRDGRFGERFTRYSCGVQCPCRAGQRLKHIGATFDRKRMCPCDYHPTPEDDEALRVFIGGESRGAEWEADDSQYQQIMGTETDGEPF